MNFECPICNEVGDALGTRENGLCMVADCGHVLHRKCIIQWQTRGNQTCPMCRQVCRKICTLYGATRVAKAKEDRCCKRCSILHTMLIGLRRSYVTLQTTLEKVRAELKEKDKIASLKDWKIVQLKSSLQLCQLRLAGSNFMHKKANKAQ